MNVLVLKTGALGDVVRTSYILPALYAKGATIEWVTSSAAIPLLRANPFLKGLTAFPSLGSEGPKAHHDWVISLDDEAEVCSLATELEFGKLTGAYLQPDGTVAYSDDSAIWFDMGLLSRFGKSAADDLKKRNTRTHDEILKEILKLEAVSPCIFIEPAAARQACRILQAAGNPLIGLNLAAGKRWPSKALPFREAVRLTHWLESVGLRPILLGGIEEKAVLGALSEEVRCPVLPQVPVDVFAALVGQLRCIITTDSLALHLAIAQRVPSVSFYAPTSAAEINTFGFGEKVVSTSADYCSYKRDADNSTITAERIQSAFQRLREKFCF
jgi:heptosyltransferase-2